MNIIRKIHNLLHPILGEVVMLHRVVKEYSPNASIRHLEFTPPHIAYLIERQLITGIEFISIEQVAKYIKEKKKNFICLTFDDGYMDNYTLAYPILKKYNIPFCIYLTKDYIEGTAHPQWSPTAEMMNEEVVRKLAADPLCTIGSHTCSHPKLSTLTEEQQEQEISHCRYYLEQLTGRRVDHFAYPHGDYDRRTIEVCKRLAIKSAVTTNGCHIRDDSHLLTLDRTIPKEPRP